MPITFCAHTNRIGTWEYGLLRRGVEWRGLEGFRVVATRMLVNASKIFDLAVTRRAGFRVGRISHDVYFATNEYMNTPYDLVKSPQRIDCDLVLQSRSALFYGRRTLSLDVTLPSAFLAIPIGVTIYEASLV